jgi:hypothetical protein
MFSVACFESVYLPYKKSGNLQFINLFLLNSKTYERYIGSTFLMEPITTNLTSAKITYHYTFYVTRVDIEAISKCGLKLTEILGKAVYGTSHKMLT